MRRLYRLQRITLHCNKVLHHKVSAVPGNFARGELDAARGNLSYATWHTRMMSGAPA